MSVLHEICLCTSLTFHSGLGSIKHLRDDANDCDLDPEDTLSDALIDEGKAQVDNSDQNVIISVIQEQTRKTENAPTIENSTPASSSIIARPSAAQISVPRFEDIESPLGKRKRVPSSEYDDRGEHQHGSVQRRKTQRSKNSRASIASESKSQPTQLASPSPSMPISEAANSVTSQAPILTAQPLTWHLNQARNMQLSLKDLNRVIIADSASNSTINSPAIEADRTPFQQATRPSFGADDDDSDDSSDESSDEEPTETEGANKGSKAVASGSGRGLPVPDPTIRDETDEDEDEDSD